MTMITSPLPVGMHEFQNTYLHLLVDEEARLLYSEWIRRPSSEEYREAAGIFARHLRGKSIAYWVQDTTRLGEVSVEDLKVMLQELVSLAISSSLRKLARINTDENQIATFLEMARQAKSGISTELEIQHFKTYREAADWMWNYIR